MQLHFSFVKVESSELSLQSESHADVEKKACKYLPNCDCDFGPELKEIGFHSTANYQI